MLLPSSTHRGQFTVALAGAASLLAYFALNHFLSLPAHSSSEFYLRATLFAAFAFYGLAIGCALTACFNPGLALERLGWCAYTPFCRLGALCLVATIPLTGTPNPALERTPTGRGAWFSSSRAFGGQQSSLSLHPLGSHESSSATAHH